MIPFLFGWLLGAIPYLFLLRDRSRERQEWLKALQTKPTEPPKSQPAEPHKSARRDDATLVALEKQTEARLNEQYPHRKKVV